MAKQLSELRSMQRNQLLRINKEELVDIILTALKPDKACGPDGISPGLLKLLPVNLLLCLVTLFNTVFLNGQYPLRWTRAKIFTIFKKGNRKDPDNYTGASVSLTP